MKTFRHRPYQGDEDIALITQFLLDTYTINQTLLNWDVRRWQGSIYHNNDEDSAKYRARLPHLVRIFEDDAGMMLGVTTHEDDGNVFLQVHPEHRWIESAMLDWSEAHLAKTTEDSQHVLEVWAYDDDVFRNDLLRELGDDC